MAVVLNWSQTCLDRLRSDVLAISTSSASSMSDQRHSEDLGCQFQCTNQLVQSVLYAGTFV